MPTKMIAGANVQVNDEGFMTNPESAELQRSELADPRADVKVAQTRQDLFLAAAARRRRLSHCVGAQ